MNQLKTSLTDNGEYPEFCDRASKDTSLFENFRRNPIYNAALEHDSQEQGREYLELAQKLSGFDSHLEEFKKNDRIGNPEIFEFDGIGEISPTTLRYIKVLSDLEQEFATLDNLSICEIGVGYGGLCRIIDSYFQVKSYCLVDLPPVLAIAQKYLSHFQVRTQITCQTAEELNPEAEYDLVISNYAFTEIRREFQEVYLKKIVLRSKRGYITYNAINPESFNSYSLDELLEIIPNLRILPEIKLTDPNDRMLVWS
jgi:putative sugar O-methyltransferase